MNGAVERVLKHGLALIAAVLIAIPASAVVSAIGAPQVVQQYVTEDSVVLYVRGVGHSGVSTAQVGQEPAAQVRMGEDAIPLVTWLLYDNSLSMPVADRTAAKDVLKELLRNHSPNERFCLATFSTDLDAPLIEDGQNEWGIADSIDGIKTLDQDSYLLNAIGSILEREQGRTGNIYTRIVVVSDGGDSGAHGTSMERIRQLQGQRNIPIYSVYCGNNSQARQDMITLSAESHGQSWDLKSIDGNSLSSTLRYRDGEMPAQVFVTIPDEARDGSIKGVQVTFDDGSAVSTQVQMPFGPPPPVPLPPPSPDDNDFPWKAVLTVFLVLLLIAGGVFLFLFLRKRRGTEKITGVGGSMYPDDGDGNTDIMTDPSNSDDDEYTMPLVNENSHLMLRLVDTNNRDNHFECPLRGKVTIGRGSSNQIILNYDKSVSSRHCEMYLDKSGNFMIHDLNSSNGTYIEGNRVVDTASIDNGSVVRMGRLEFEVTIR